jgi:hypothetical protein
VKKLLIALGALFVLGIAAVVVVSMVAANQFGPMAEKFLADWKAGKRAEVYAATAKEFRDVTSFEKLEAILQRLHDGLGEFRRVAKTTGGGMGASTSTGRTGSVTNELEFEKGRAKGKFEFVKQDGEWRLVSFEIEPEKGVEPTAADRSALEGKGRDLLRLYDESSFADLYARFSRPLQDAWKRQTYDEQVAALRAKTGKVTEATLRETKDSPEGGVATVFDLRFEAGPGEATFRWEWTGHTWALVGFQLRPL